MKHSRKKRTPYLNLDKLKEVGSQIRAEGDLGALASYFLLLERMEQEGVLTAPFIALEALARITTARTEGYQEGDILKSCPEAWGQQTVSIPLPLLMALLDTWELYRSADTGVNLGETFGIEGKGQGKDKMKRKFEQRLKENRISNAVELAYVSSGHTGERSDAVSLDRAIEQVAEFEGLSVETVKAYHKKHNKYLRSVLKDINLIKG